MRTAGGRATYREMCRHVHHICFLLDLLQLLLKLLMRSRSHTATPCDLKSPIRYARRGCPRLNSNRGASAAAVLVSLRRDTTLPACSYAFTIGKFRRCFSSPPCSTFGGWRLFPTGLPSCPALECWSSSQPAPREQGPAPTSSPKAPCNLRYSRAVHVQMVFMLDYWSPTG